ncbi:protein SMAX1-LIKE 3 [Senna tora]|uniref:Protein SMAX1-LIKE 3 n=1 Tax=Senna tora TaxID=362788 RepID=A0A834SL16_9FABA|nr:protein SMAX1-LIKE 3 [Senna tora]
MRSPGGSCCGVQLQQGLTAEAAMIVKQAVTLAKRRGHAQVTPLHVANAMLSSPNALLRTACLHSQSHSHPLHCKALELCFNVALNRLPASSTSAPPPPIFALPMGPSFSPSPSISNALLAAFKRAQAHQRRLDTTTTTQQPVLALKIELEQLVISILDDPSVSRVMREAGFSSTLVKINVEQALDQLCSQSHLKGNINEYNPTTTSSSDPPVRSEDVWSVIDSLRRRSTVVVGECVSRLESVVRGVMDKVEKGDDVDIDEEVDNKIEELKSLAKTRPPGKGIVLYVGDLKWVLEYRAPSNSSYCAVEHMIKEVGKLVMNGINNNDEEEQGSRFRVMGIATFQTFMKCKNGDLSLENVWGLHPLTIPAAPSLRFSLVTTHTYSTCGVEKESSKKGENESKWWVSAEPESEDEEKQPQQVPSLHTSTPLPAWLQHSKHHNKTPTSAHHQKCVPVGEQCKKWNSVCTTQTPIIHKQGYDQYCEKNLTIVSSVSLSPTSPFSYNPPHHQWLVPEQPPRDHSFRIPQPHQNPNHNIPTLTLYIPEHNPINIQPPPSINPTSTSNPNSTSSTSSEAMETEYVSKFKEVSSENLKTLINALEKQVPWHKDVLPDMVSTILQCRSGMLRRKVDASSSEAKHDTWLFFQGADVEAKEKIGRELGRLIFGGGPHNLVSIKIVKYSSCRKKRRREEQSCSCGYIEELAEAVWRNPHGVFMLEGIEEADSGSLMALKKALERGILVDSNGKQVCLGDAIIILTSQTFFTSSNSTPCSPSSLKQHKDDDHNKNMATLDLNISIDDGNDCDEDPCVDDIDVDILESVDRRIIFKIQD